MRRLGALILLAAMLAGSPALAHHSAAMFDQDKLVVLKGWVKSFAYINPHSWISIVGSPDGTTPPDRWDVEATSPSSLERLGMTAETLKPGDKVTVGIRPLRDGRRGGSMVFVVGADGKRFGADPQALGLRVEDLIPH